MSKVRATRSKPAAPASPNDSTTSRLNAKTWGYIGALAAVLCWAGAFALLFLGNLASEASPLAPQRVLFYLLIIGAGLLTFLPLEIRMRLRGITLEGTAGFFLLLYTLAFVPPPTRWLLHLPDMPVYALFLLAFFWSASALLMPFVYALGRLLFTQRMRQNDVPRARRQAHLLSLLFTWVIMLSTLNALSIVSVLVLVFMVMLAEILFLARLDLRPTQP
ncbi:MAG: hypothetical protein HC911_15495 [Chloroflexaceae bacterium]|nr:hypothetical protein [Chloroflexaceae bacterium]